MANFEELSKMSNTKLFQFYEKQFGHSEPLGMAMEQRNRDFVKAILDYRSVQTMEHLTIAIIVLTVFLVALTIALVVLTVFLAKKG